MKREPSVDFFIVEHHHIAIHDRLCNWARWVKPGRGSSGMAPMFRQFCRTETVLDPSDAPQAAADGIDGLKVEKAVTQLPERNCAALQWCYVFHYVHSQRIARLLGVNERGLHVLVTDGRSMVKNRLHSSNA